MELFRQITANNIELKPYPFLKELAMEAYLMENGDVLKLDSENFNDVEILDAEIALKSGRKTSNRDGRIDILAKYGIDYLSIIELKTNEINLQTLEQLSDYLKEKDQLITKYPEYWEEEHEPKWIGVLVGRTISNELQTLISNGYETEDGIPIAAMTIKRYRSDNSDVYVITDTFFKYKYHNKDRSKFEFLNIEYNKARLVNAVISNFAQNNPNVTYNELEKLFPQELQNGSTGIFTTKENANEVFEKSGYKRYYIKPVELINLSDSTIATSTQWGIDNIMNFVNHVNENFSNLKILGK